MDTHEGNNEWVDWEEMHWLTVAKSAPELIYNALSHFGSYAAALHYALKPYERKRPALYKAAEKNEKTSVDAADESIPGSFPAFHYDPAYVPTMWTRAEVEERLEEGGED